MKKLFGISATLLVLVLACYASTKLRDVTLVNSTVNSTTIGATVPSTGVFSTLTVSSFTGNKCLHTDGSGFEVEAAGNCTGVHQFAVAPTCGALPAVAWGTCNTTLGWPVAFANTSYSVACSVINAHATGGGNSAKVLLNSVTKTTTTATIYIANSGSDADLVFDEIDCVADHT